MPNFGVTKLKDYVPILPKLSQHKDKKEGPHSLR